MAFSCFHSAVTTVTILNYLMQVYIFTLLIQTSVLISHALHCLQQYRTLKFQNCLSFPHPFQLTIISKIEGT